MDAFTATLAALLVGLPAFYRDVETPEEREMRMVTVVAPALVDVASEATCSGAYATVECKKLWPGTKLDLVLMLVTKGWWESRFAVHVQAGKCGPRECDAYKDHYTKKIVHRAASYFQVQATGLVPMKEWRTLTGLDYEPTRRAAWAAAKVASASRNRCARSPGSWEFVTVSAYASGRSCSWRGAHQRVRWFGLTKARFQTLLLEAEKAPEGRPAKET